MAWEQLSIDKPHLVYIVLGGFTTLFMLCSSIIKERLYIGEATVATICGIIFGPHAANLIDPGTWGNTDQITLEFARIVLVVQCFAVGVELPKAYMERHWRSVTFLLIPVMTFGWLITSLFIWGLIPSLDFLDSLCVAACVTATDPVLASSVVGKGKFAKRVPKHLRDLLSAESGCNDGMAFPFIYLALYIIRYHHHPDEVALHWFCYTILYECVFGAFYGVVVGYAARRAIRYAHEKDLIDRESFLVFYFVLALFCAGSGSLLGMDDLLIGFACGVGFSNDGWFTEKTEEAHVSNVIDLLINLAFFVYFGTIIPWEQFNSSIIGLSAWRLVVIGLLVLLFRRIPIMMALKPVIPDIKTWREALFAGHFGPIGVGALFVAIMARAELETETTTPLAVLPPANFPHDNIIELIWPVTTFLVICSIIVHGSSIAVFTLGKHINTLTLTMSYTQANDEGVNWMDRLPRIQSRSKTSMSRGRDDTESEIDEKEKANFAPGTLPPIGMPGNFLRRQKEEDNPSRGGSRSSSRHRSKKSRSNWDSGRGPGGPISQSAIAPVARKPEDPSSRSDSDTLAVKSDESESSHEKKDEAPVREEEREDDPHGDTGEIFEEGQETVYEDDEGDVLEVEQSREEDKTQQAREEHEVKEGRRLMHEQHAKGHHGVAQTQEPKEDPGQKAKGKVAEADHATERPGKNWRSGLHKMSTMRGLGQLHEKPKAEKVEAKRGPARAYQFGNTIIVEDEDGEVIKKYDIPAPNKKPDGPEPRRRLGRMGTMLGMGSGKDAHAAEPSGSGDSAAPVNQKRKPTAPDDDDDERVRFTVSAGGRRMSKAEFIQQIKQLDPKSRVAMVEDSDVPEAVKREARADAHEQQTDQIQTMLTAMPESPSDERGMAALKMIDSNASAERGPEGLTLVDSNNQDIPFHDISGELHKHSMQSPSGETAAQRRRRQAFKQPEQAPDEEDSEDDGTERVPPPTRGREEHRPSDTGETAAERRRREGALGLTTQDSDSEEDDEPRQVPLTRGIRFADQQPPSTPNTSGGGQSRLRWGKDVGR